MRAATAAGKIGAMSSAVQSGPTGRRRWWKRVPLVIGVAYGAFAALARVGAEYVIFLPHHPGYELGGDISTIPTSNDEHIAVLTRMIPDAPFTVLFLHGNQEDLSEVHDRLDVFAQLGFSSVAIDYRGYGRSDGTATEASAYLDADAAFTYLTEALHVPPHQIIVLGRSLGGAIAIDLAARREIGGLVVESTFTTAFRVALRIRILPFDQFTSIDKIGHVDCPVAVMHGTTDALISLRHGQELFAAAPGPKLSLWVDDATHQDLLEMAGDRYGETVSALAKLIQTKLIQ